MRTGCRWRILFATRERARKISKASPLVLATRNCLMNEPKLVRLDLVNLEQRRNALALECTYQIDVLMLLANLADELESESQRSAVRSLTIRSRELTAILMGVLRGADASVGDWELRVFGSLQGSPTAPASEVGGTSRTPSNFEPF